MFLLLCESQSANPVFPTPAVSRARHSSSKAQPHSAAQSTASAAALVTAAAPAFQLHAQHFQSQHQAPVTFSVQSSPTLSLFPNLLMDQRADEPAAADKYAANLSHAPQRDFLRHQWPSGSISPVRFRAVGSPVPSTDILRHSLPSPSPGVPSTNLGLNSSLSAVLCSAWQYMSVALAPSTNSSYSTAWSAFLDLAFIIYLRDILRLSPSSIKSCISSIQHFYWIMSIPAPALLSIPAVSLTLCGIERSLPPSFPSRLPITSDILLNLISIVRHGCFNPVNYLVMESICLV
ncbi:hypothetical protein EOD39_18072 [Acipenser ruthenus]|uniref:Uncharacterized protein n=1 Tax=Acipenser ruthenus TaxID=7906 RepID=A0A444V1V3_ACIRT|nr:hypothetical protein EOD39_18072 [Acipenser ruthenus]